MNNRKVGASNMKTLAETLLNYYQEHEEDFNHDIEEMDSCLSDGAQEIIGSYDELKEME